MGCVPAPRQPAATLCQTGRRRRSRLSRRGPHEETISTASRASRRQGFTVEQHCTRAAPGWAPQRLFSWQRSSAKNRSLARHALPSCRRNHWRGLNRKLSSGLCLQCNRQAPPWPLLQDLKPLRQRRSWGPGCVSQRQATVLRVSSPRTHLAFGTEASEAFHPFPTPLGRDGPCRSTLTSEGSPHQIHACL